MAALATGPAATQTQPQDVEHVLRRGVRAVYQPVVDIDRQDVVGYEELVRGEPPLATPAELFAAAAQHGLTTELDWACRAAAFKGALEGGLRPPATLFINALPCTIGVEPPEQLQLLARRAAADLKIIVEVSEQHVLDDPAEMLDKLERVRDLGWGVALDDVGRDMSSVALLTLVRPDVVKIDPHLIQEPLTPETTRIVMALGSFARESGAQLLAEGVETAEHLVRARAIGASLAQGCRFGWATELPAAASRRRTGTVRIPRAEPVRDETPGEVAELTGLRWRSADESAVQDIVGGLEEQAASSRAPAIVLSCFLDGDSFTAETAARYEQLAKLPAFITVFGRGITPAPALQVRGIHVPADHRLSNEWALIVITPAFAGMVVARPEGDGRFAYTVSDDRSIVVRAARALARSSVSLG
jgi:EAL domain-containing protein (putative c-di-GMP-specific phosphodiesterase class I)